MTGKAAPETEKPVPEIAAELTVTDPVPVDVSTTVFVDEDPTATLPKLRLVGLTVSVGEVVPLPLRATAVVGLVEELLLMVSAPVADPPAVGANFTVRVRV